MLHQSSAEAGGGGTAGQECRKLGTDMNFWRILPEIRCLSQVYPRQLKHPQSATAC